jgi:hypothetical protein
MAGRHSTWNSGESFPGQHKTEVKLMNNIFRSALGAILILTSVTAFSCDYPARPFIPDGATASKEELLAAKNNVQVYLSAVDEYLQCVELEDQAALAALDNPTPEQQEELNQSLNRKFDAANEEKEMVGDQFNQQVRAYNAERKKSD